MSAVVIDLAKHSEARFELKQLLHAASYGLLNEAGQRRVEALQRRRDGSARGHAQVVRGEEVERRSSAVPEYELDPDFDQDRYVIFDEEAEAIEVHPANVVSLAAARSPAAIAESARVL